MAADTDIPPQTPPNLVVLVATVFIAIILAIAAFIFGTPVFPTPGGATLPNLEESAAPVSPTPTISTPSASQEPVFCTLEAKLCPDGSAVGRVGPNCEFAPCPGE